jgi:hypothetical protein
VCARWRGSHRWAVAKVSPNADVKASVTPPDANASNRIWNVTVSAMGSSLAGTSTNNLYLKSKSHRFYVIVVIDSLLLLSSYRFASEYYKFINLPLYAR